MNTASVQAFCSVVRREGSCTGSCRLTLPMFASPGLAAIFTASAAPLALLALACVEADSDGLNGRPAQPPTWKRLEGFAVAPSELLSDAATDIAAQLVGLNVKFGRSSVIATERSFSGIPLRIVGSASDLAMICAVAESTNSGALTTTLPRSNGPATAGVITTALSGAPS